MIEEETYMAANSRKEENSHMVTTSRKAVNPHQTASPRKATTSRKTANTRSSPLSAEQKALLQKLGLPTNFKNLSTDDRLEIDDIIGEELYENGIDEATDAPNAYGCLCESILEALES